MSRYEKAQSHTGARIKLCQVGSSVSRTANGTFSVLIEKAALKISCLALVAVCPIFLASVSDGAWEQLDSR